MASAISPPIRNADSFVRPGSSTNMLSVSPYTTRAPHVGCELMKSIAASKVARPVATMASANSAQGMRPEKPAQTANNLSTLRHRTGSVVNCLPSCSNAEQIYAVRMFKLVEKGVCLQQCNHR